MKTIFRTVLLVVLLLSPAAAQVTFAQDGDDIKFDHLTIEDGLSQSSVSAILQDKRGMMWFGTWDGLNRYDGYQFTIYRHNPQNPYSLSHNRVQSLYEDSQGILWVGTMDGLNQFDREKERFIRYQHDADDPASLAGNKVHAITEDKDAMLWVGTEDGGLSKFDRSTGQFFHYQHNPDDPNSLSHNDVRAVCIDSQGVLWIGTWGGGLNRFDPATERFTSYQHDPNNPTSLSDNFVRTVYEDQRGVLWVGTQSGGLSRFNEESQQFTNYLPDPNNPFSLSDKDVLSIRETQTGELWIGTYGGGLNKFDRTNQHFIHYQPTPGLPTSLNDNNVWTLYEERSGILWVGTAEGGINKKVPNLKHFNHFKNNPDDPNSLSGNDIWSFCEDRDGVLWVGVWDYGLNRFDRQTGKLTHYMPDPENPFSLSQQDVTAIVEDHEGTLWIGTNEGGLNRFDRRTGRFTHYAHDPNDPQSLAHNNVFALYEDRQHTLWMGSYYGKSLSKFDRETETFVNYTHDPENPDSISDYQVWFLFEDSHGDLWLTTSGGLSRFDRQTERFTHYTHVLADPKSLSHNPTTMIHEDQAGNLWIGTRGGGLNKFDRATGNFTAYREQDGLPSDTVVGILEDEKGNLWLSTFRGLAQFNPNTETFKNYTPADGLQSYEFNLAVAFKSRDGQMFFGGINGFNAFYPQEIQDNPYIPPVVLTDFQIFNRSVSIGDDSILNKAIGELNEITLSYQESVFTFEFAALDYTFPEKNRYRYKLEGFEDDWNEVDSTRRFATYTNLDPGEYVFRVIGSNNDGIWNEEGASIKITVTPPWWETTWFRGAMLLLAIGIVFGGFRRRVRSIEQRSRELEIQVAERTAELAIAKDAAEKARRLAEVANQAKSTFLANMSHELRTPLNAILGFSQLMQRDSALTADQQENLETIGRSGEHLLILINDVLELSKIEAGRVTLSENNFDLYRLLDDLASMFHLRAIDRGLQLRFERAPDVPQYIHTDEGKLRQVLVNLLSNAIKFTQEGGITLRVGTGATHLPGALHLHFEIEDTGIGIAPDELEDVFEPFVQTESGQQARRGTGLGLPISRQYVQLMGGDISVRSEVGQGTTSRFDIQVSQVEAAAVATTEAARRVIGLAPNQPVYRLLLVEDEVDSRKLLVKLLEPLGFDIREASNGREGIEVWERWQPDLIWMDMRMPVMDGYEATRQIKAQAGASAPAIIALTASAFEEDRAAVLAVGCDDFVRKPFREAEIFEMLHKHLGIDFVYAVEPESVVDQGVLTADRLQALPGEWRAALQDAAVETNPGAANAVIQQIREQDAPLADALTGLVKTYRFDILQELLGETE